MAKISQRIPEEMQRWLDARRKFHLSHAHIQMARELGLNPRELGGLANHRQEPWEAPLPIRPAKMDENMPALQQAPGG
jgi:hypothetical protein